MLGGECRSVRREAHDGGGRALSRLVAHDLAKRLELRADLGLADALRQREQAECAIELGRAHWYLPDLKDRRADGGGVWWGTRGTSRQWNTGGRVGCAWDARQEAERVRLGVIKR